ncbi:MAG: O-antigen ligase family protein, partial [Actinomycetota bacterium]
MVFIFRAKDKSSLRRFPLPLMLLIGYMALSTIWSNYPLFTILAVTTQLITTLSAVFLALQFDWRQLLNLFANTIRLILALSLIVELVAAFTGPLRPIFANFEGETPPSPAYWWVQGNLFQSERIQGFVGNANLLAYIAVLGLVIFFVEYLVTYSRRRISVVSLFAAAGFLALAKSASMMIALLIVIAAAVVAMFAEGQPRSIRHRVYARAFWIGLFIVFLAIAYWEEITDFLGKSSDASGRFDIWAKVWTLISQRPIEGWGWISHWVPGVAPYEGLAVIDNVPYYHAHNAFLDVWLQLGIIGLIIFFWLLWSTFSRVWKIAVRHTNPLYFW